MLGHARERILSTPLRISHVPIRSPFRDIIIYRTLFSSYVSVQHDSFLHHRKNLSKMADRIGQMVEDSNVMEDVARQVRLFGDSFFDIPYENFRRCPECRASDDGLDHVFDPAVRCEHSPGQSGERYGVDSLETTHLQHNEIPERETTVELNDTTIGNPLGCSALADRPWLPKSPATFVEDIAAPGEKVVEPAQVLIFQ